MSLCRLLDSFAEAWVAHTIAPLFCALGVHVWISWYGRVPYYGLDYHQRCVWCRAVKVKP